MMMMMMMMMVVMMAMIMFHFVTYLFMLEHVGDVVVHNPFDWMVKKK